MTVSADEWLASIWRECTATYDPAENPPTVLLWHHGEVIWTFPMPSLSSPGDRLGVDLPGKPTIYAEARVR